MKARVNFAFYDKAAKQKRKVGESFEVTEKRFDEINAAGFGELVVKVEEPASKPAKAPARKPAKKVEDK